MITVGAAADGLLRMRAEVKADPAAAAGAASDTPSSDEAFGELLAVAVSVDPADVGVIPPHANPLLDAHDAVLQAPVDGNAVPDAGRFLPHLIPGFAGPGTATAGTIPTLTLDLQQVGGGQVATVLAEALERRTSGREVSPEFMLQHASTQEAPQRAVTSATAPGSASLTPGQPGFDQSLGQRLVLMVQQGVQYARVSIHPEHLGPLEIRLKLDADGAHVVLQSPHAAVRDVLEQALPRLREVLGDGGLELVDVDIGDPGQQASERDPEATTQTADRAEPGAGDEGGEASERTVTAPRGLLDTFA